MLRVIIVISMNILWKCYLQVHGTVPYYVNVFFQFILYLWILFEMLPAVHEMLPYEWSFSDQIILDSFGISVILTGLWIQIFSCVASWHYQPCQLVSHLGCICVTLVWAITFWYWYTTYFTRSTCEMNDLSA